LNEVRHDNFSDMSTFEFFGYCVLSSVFFPIGYYFYRLGYGSSQAEYAKKFHANTSLPPKDDVGESRRKVICYLYQRCRDMNLDIRETGLARALENLDVKLKCWIYFFHTLGCEMVIRKVADSDIGENTKDLNEFLNEIDDERRRYRKENGLK